MVIIIKKNIVYFPNYITDDNGVCCQWKYFFESLYIFGIFLAKFYHLWEMLSIDFDPVPPYGLRGEPPIWADRIPAVDSQHCGCRCPGARLPTAAMLTRRPMTHNTKRYHITQHIYHVIAFRQTEIDRVQKVFIPAVSLYTFFHINTATALSSLWPSDAICLHKTWPLLACSTTSHYPIQHWLVD